MKIFKRSLYICFLLCYLYPTQGFATIVLTADELRGFMEEGTVKEMYFSDMTIEGTLDDEGTNVPFMVFIHSKEVSDDLIRLAKERGIKHEFKFIEELPVSSRIPTAFFFQLGGTVLTLGLWIGVLIALISINKNLKQVIVLLKK